MRKQTDIESEIKDINNKKIINQLIDLGSLNNHGHDTCRTVFGTGDTLEKKPQNMQNLTSGWWEYDSEQGYFQEFANKTNMPDLLQEVYYEISHMDTEFVINEEHSPGYTFFSLNKLYKNIYDKNKYCDFATKYCGMGHIEVVSWRFSDGKCFRRMMGGANGYDRDYHEEWAASIDTEKSWSFKWSYSKDSKTDTFCIKDGYLFEISKFFEYIINRPDNTNTEDFREGPKWKMINGYENF
jgi:hypothetical protein